MHIEKEFGPMGYNEIFQKQSFYSLRVVQCNFFINHQDTYLVEISDPLPTLPGIPLEFSHGLDNTEEGTIAVNLLPLVVSSPERLRAMAAHFHLLCVLTMTQHNNLEEVDALLGTSVSHSSILDPSMEKNLFVQAALL